MGLFKEIQPQRTDLHAGITTLSYSDTCIEH